MHVIWHGTLAVVKCCNQSQCGQGLCSMWQLSSARLCKLCLHAQLCCVQLQIHSAAALTTAIKLSHTIKFKLAQKGQRKRAGLPCSAAWIVDVSACGSCIGTQLDLGCCGKQLYCCCACYMRLVALGTVVSLCRVLFCVALLCCCECSRCATVQDPPYDLCSTPWCVLECVDCSKGGTSYWCLLLRLGYTMHMLSEGFIDPHANQRVLNLITKAACVIPLIKQGGGIVVGCRQHTSCLACVCCQQRCQQRR
jgi:hypothetical protein